MATVNNSQEISLHALPNGSNNEKAVGEPPITIALERNNTVVPKKSDSIDTVEQQLPSSSAAVEKSTHCAPKEDDGLDIVVADENLVDRSLAADCEGRTNSPCIPAISQLQQQEKELLSSQNGEGSQPVVVDLESYRKAIVDLDEDIQKQRACNEKFNPAPLVHVHKSKLNEIHTRIAPRTSNIPPIHVPTDEMRMKQQQVAKPKFVVATKKAQPIQLIATKKTRDLPPPIHVPGQAKERQVQLEPLEVSDPVLAKAEDSGFHQLSDDEVSQQHYFPPSLPTNNCACGILPFSADTFKCFLMCS